MIRSYWQAFLVIFIIEFSVILSGFWMLGDYGPRRFNFWPISEWLINYQAGFVRRGLAGEILHLVNSEQGVIKLLNPLVFFFYFLFIAITLAVYRLSGVRDSIVLILALLIPGGIFHMAMGTLFYPRKEILFLIHFGILCVLYLWIFWSEKRAVLLCLHLFGCVAIAGGVILSLVHEAYLFMAYPITALLFFILVKDRSQYSFIKNYFVIYLISIPFVFLLCSLNRGDATMAQAIWDSYSLTDRLILAPAAPYTAAFATAGLGWTLTQHLSTIYGVFVTGTWKYWLFFAIANTFAILFIASRITNLRNKELDINATGCIDDPSLIQITSLALLISSSMFLIASDYGRWIACATNLTLLFSLTVSRSTFIHQAQWLKRLPRQLFIDKFLSVSHPLISLVVVLLYSLIFQMPECCVNNYDIFIPYVKFISLFYQ